MTTPRSISTTFRLFPCAPVLKLRLRARRKSTSSNDGVRTYHSNFIPPYLPPCTLLNLRPCFFVLHTICTKSSYSNQLATCSRTSVYNDHDFVVQEKAAVHTDFERLLPWTMRTSKAAAIHWSKRLGLNRSQTRGAQVWLLRYGAGMCTHSAAIVVHRRTKIYASYIKILSLLKLRWPLHLPGRHGSAQRSSSVPSMTTRSLLRTVEAIGRAL